MLRLLRLRLLKLRLLRLLLLRLLLLQLRRWLDRRSGIDSCPARLRWCGGLWMLRLRLLRWRVLLLWPLW